MDYTGLLQRKNGCRVIQKTHAGKPISYLDKKTQASDHPCDWMSVIKINGTYIEIADRWYPVKGYATWQGGLIIISCLIGIISFLKLGIEKSEAGVWVICTVATAIFSLFSFIGVKGLSLENFQETHYPIRLCRKNRKIYAKRADGSIFVDFWDRTKFSIEESRAPLLATTFSITARVFEKDFTTLKEDFTLAYPYFGGRKDAENLWEYIRRYMEDIDGVKECCNNLSLILPIEHRREGLLFSIVRIFAPAANHPIVQLILSPLLSLTVVGRWLSMRTSAVPAWPDDIVAECQVDPDDPYQKDWRDNGEYHFLELGWPIICFCVGLCVLGVGVAWLVNELFFV